MKKHSFRVKSREIFISVKADDKNLYLDRMIFVESGKKER